MTTSYDKLTELVHAWGDPGAHGQLHALLAEYEAGESTLDENVVCLLGFLRDESQRRMDTSMALAKVKQRRDDLEEQLGIRRIGEAMAAHHAEQAKPKVACPSCGGDLLEPNMAQCIEMIDNVRRNPTLADDGKTLVFPDDAELDWDSAGGDRLVCLHCGDEITGVPFKID